MGMPVTLFQYKTETDSPVYEKYRELAESRPGLRHREIAQALQVSEAELIDNACGVGRLRLNQDFSGLIYALPELGYIMSLTRNDGAVHERKGVYDNVSIKGAMGLVISKDRKIDLRIILSQWQQGFAVCELVKGKYRFSLQFFDCHGDAIQKIYLQPSSNVQAYFDIVHGFIASNQKEPLVFKKKEPTAQIPDAHIDQESLQKDWAGMTDVHQFLRLLRKHGAAREQALRVVGDWYAVPFDPSLLVRILQLAAHQDIPLMCFVSNPGNIQIHSGKIEKVRRVGNWLNILDPEFNLHLLEPALQRAWLVRKPTGDGIVTSLEFYNNDGVLLVQFFGVREEGSAENTHWRELAESVLKADN